VRRQSRQCECVDFLTDNASLATVFPMSTEQLIADAMALPLAERVSLAQALWESIDGGLPVTEERDAVSEAIQRNEELSSGKVAGRTHEEVMQAARRALECD
jgi:putative addiction module component (TIGR02574 family)